jgi:branched-chain amino acid transport system ATP-binding protein
MILQVEELTKAFGGLMAVDHVSLNFEKGEISSIIGPNGAGKSTLFNLITNHIYADSGKVVFKGENITKLAPERIQRKGLCRTFQITSIFGRLTVFENVLTAMISARGMSLNLFSRAKKLFRKETLAVLDSVGLANQAGLPANALAHGDQRRLEIAIAVASSPEILLLDEPAAGLSVDESAGIMELIGRLARERGLTLIFVEHDMKVVFAISEKIRVMHFGRVIAEGTADEIKRNEEVKRIYLGEA